MKLDEFLTEEEIRELPQRLIIPTTECFNYSSKHCDTNRRERFCCD